MADSTMSHQVVLVGMARRMQSFNLPHEVYCEALGECQCSERPVVVSQYSKVTQEWHKKIVNQRINKSITVGFRKRVSVAKAALECPEIKKALTSKPRRLRLES